MTYNGGPALFLKLCPILVLSHLSCSPDPTNNSKPTDEILNTRGGNLITQLKLSTHHQSRFRDQKVHTTSTYLTKTANQMDLQNTQQDIAHCFVGLQKVGNLILEFLAATRLLLQEPFFLSFIYFFNSISLKKRVHHQSWPLGSVTWIGCQCKS